MKSHHGLGGQGEMSGSYGAMRVPLVCAPHVVLAVGLQGTLACPKVFPAGWPGVQEPCGTRRGPLAKSHVPRASPQSPVRLLHTCPRLWGSTEEAAWSRVLCLLLGLQGRRSSAGCWWRWPGTQGEGSTIGRPNQASRQTDEGNDIITPRTPWGRYSKYHIK